MSVASRLAAIVAEVTSEPNYDLALDRLAQAAMELTESRHVLIALLNEERGSLEVKHGAGEGFRAIEKGENLPLNIGSSDGIVGFVAETGDTFDSGDVTQAPQYRRLFESTRSEMAIPVKDRHNRVWAVLNLESDQKNAYGEEQKDVAVALAHLVGVVVEQQDHVNREQALISVGNSLDAVLTEEALVDRVIHVAKDVLRMQACSIFLLDPRIDRFVLEGTIGRLKDDVGQLSYARGEGFTGWVCDQGQPILLDSPQGDPRWRGKFVEFPSEQIASFLAVPIVTRTGSIGAIRVLRRRMDNKLLDNSFTNDDLQLLQAIAEQMAIGLENIRNIEKIVRSERMIAWGELSAKSSHMIGNRVFALKGDVNELKHVLDSPDFNVEDIRALQKSLNTNITRVEEILQDFRDFVTATKLNRTLCDLNEVVSETVEEVFPRRSSVELDLKLGEVPKLLMDEKKLRRAISELIENSFNYMDKGRLRISTQVVGNEIHDQTRHSKLGRFASIEIEDNGPGVDNDQKALIFQPFFSKRVKGMGLGLSIVKGIVDAHGGEVFEAGQEGTGAKFVILLPLES